MFDGLPHDHASSNHGHGHGNQSRHHRNGHVLEQTALARLAADETHLQRRQHNVQNFGSAWLRPPGIAKTLHQMREEKREQEEHQEALRRERLAQELAEAEAEAAAETMEDEQGMDDVQLDGAQDLDDEIPDADDDFGFGGDSDEEEEEPEDDDEEEPQDSDEEDEIQRESRANDLMAARMRMSDDAFRQALVRGETSGDDMYGGEEELEEQDQGHLLGEDDFADTGVEYADGEDDMGMGMGADLDDDIPEAESGMYEHTDSEEDLSSSEAPGSPVASDNNNSSELGDDDDIGFEPRTAPLGPPESPTLGTRSRRNTNVSAGGRASMDLSAFLSQDESSFMDSSPIQRRRQ